MKLATIASICLAATTAAPRRFADGAPFDALMSLVDQLQDEAMALTGKYSGMDAEVTSLIDQLTKCKAGGGDGGGGGEGGGGGGGEGGGEGGESGGGGGGGGMSDDPSADSDSNEADKGTYGGGGGGGGGGAGGGGGGGQGGGGGITSSDDNSSSSGDGGGDMTPDRASGDDKDSYDDNDGEGCSSNDGGGNEGGGGGGGDKGGDNGGGGGGGGGGSGGDENGDEDSGEPDNGGDGGEDGGGDGSGDGGGDSGEGGGDGGGDEGGGDSGEGGGGDSGGDRGEDGGGGGGSGKFKFHAGQSWNYNLATPVDTKVKVDVFFIDMGEKKGGTIDTLHGLGKGVVCYISIGTVEDWRDDAKQFPSSAIGGGVDGWAGERWLDVNNMQVREIMSARVKKAEGMKCDAIEPDNMMVYSEGGKVGVKVSEAEQIEYNRWFAKEVHAHGMAVGLKNAVDLVPILVGDFDFALNEECHEWDECRVYEDTFIAQNKPVFNVEYNLGKNICDSSNKIGIDTIIKDYDLDASLCSCADSSRDVNCKHR
ncbi:unnamed protein product [Laminaria digitata]